MEMKEEHAIGYDEYDMSAEDLIPDEDVVSDHDQFWLH